MIYYKTEFLVEKTDDEIDAILGLLRAEGKKPIFIEREHLALGIYDWTIKFEINDK